MSSEETTSQIEVVKQQSKPKRIKIKKKKPVLVESTTNKETNIKNKGTGAGGSKTTKNGSPYEDNTELNDHYTEIQTNKHSKKIKFKGSDNIYVTTKQSDFNKYLNDKINTDIKALHGTKRPDEAFINENDKTIFIIEKKFQQTSGSKCECIQTATNKKRNYQKRIPEYKIVYIYCLSDWFKKNCEAEIEDLIEDKIPFFWGNNPTYKDDIINFILNYK